MHRLKRLVEQLGLTEPFEDWGVIKSVVFCHLVLIGWIVLMILLAIFLNINQLR